MRSSHMPERCFGTTIQRRLISPMKASRAFSMTVAERSISPCMKPRHLGVTRDVVRMWERGEREPRARYYPAIIGFLDDDSWLPSTTLPELIKRFRLLRGWSQKRFGEWLGYSERTIGRWEDGLSPPSCLAGKLRTATRNTPASADDPATDPGKK